MIKSTVQWYRRNVQVHGAIMLFFSSFLYLSQAGVAPVVGSYFYISAYGMEIDGADIQRYRALATLPWTFKFVIGMISDNLPLFGYNAKPYMFVMAFFGFLATLVSGIPQITDNFTKLSYGLFFIRLYGAFCDCLGDSLIVKSGKKDEEDASSGLQSISWSSYAVGGAIFGIIATQLQTDVTMEDEVSVDGSRTYNLLACAFPIIFFVLLFFVKEEKTKIRPGLKSLGQQFVRLLVVFLSPPFIVLRTSAFIFLSRVGNFNYSAGMDLFKLDVIAINPATQGWIDACAYGFMIIGTIVYYRFFRQTSFRRIYGFTQGLIALFTFTDYIFVRQWNDGIIPNIVFLITTGNMYQIIDQLNGMPFLVMSAQLCPDNMEATFFALLMSISNFGGTMSELVGSDVQEAYDVGVQLPDETFDLVSLPTVILINMATNVCVILFIFMVPDTHALSPANAESLNPTNPYIIKMLKWADMYNPHGDKKVGDGVKAEAKE
jgi:hypothetical protein